MTERRAAELAKAKRFERRIERAAVEHAYRYGIDAIKLNLQGRRGWPDRLFLLPRGRPLFIEFKRTSKDVPRPLQERVHARLRKLGYKICVCASLEEAKKVIDAAF